MGIKKELSLFSIPILPTFSLLYVKHYYFLPVKCFCHSPNEGKENSTGGHELSFNSIPTHKNTSSCIDGLITCMYSDSLKTWHTEDQGKPLFKLWTFRYQHTISPCGDG